MSMWDDEAGYSRDDPKHPGWADAHAERADHVRKAVRESAPARTTLGMQPVQRNTWRRVRIDHNECVCDGCWIRYLAGAPASQDAPLSSRLRTEAADWDAGEDIAPLLVEAAEAIELLAAHVATLTWEKRRPASQDAPERVCGKLGRARDQARYTEDLLRQTTGALENLLGRLA